MSKFFNIFKIAKNAPEYKELTELLSESKSFQDLAIKAHNVKLKALQ